MALIDKSKQNLDGILKHLNDFLDKRFGQARRINPSAARAEADMRLHMGEVMHSVLARPKGFGPERLVVANILASDDAEKRTALFNPTDQVSLLNEIVPVEEELKQRRAGQLEIHDVRTLYRSLDPSLEKILTLVETWIWWDLLDAAERYRFDVQERILQNLRGCTLDATLVEYYRQVMKTRPGVELTRADMAKCELARAKEILDRFEARRQSDGGHQIIGVNLEREGNAEADACAVRLAKRLTAAEKMRLLGDGEVEKGIRDYYAPQIGLPADRVTAQAIADYENRLARRDRQTLLDLLTNNCVTGETLGYKQVLLQDMRKRFDSLCAIFGATAHAAPPAPAAAVAALVEPAPSQASERLF
jgi:hypothetical protein